ncbi:MAG TPA: DUF4340 domain-containing protein [Terriglobales bacterium]
MQSRGLYIAVAVLIILGGTLYWSNHRKPSDDSSKASADTPPTILKLDQSSIDKLELKKKDAPALVLAKGSSGDWQITDPKPLRADQSAVSGMLADVSSLNSERLVDDKASNLAPFGLDQPALELDISHKDNKSQRLLIGNNTPTGSVYAALANDPRVFTIASYTKTSLDKSLNDLRDKRLLPVSADKVSQIELIRKGEDIEFGRNKDAWQILKPQPYRADGTQVSDLLNKLTDAKMDLAGSDAGDASSAFAKSSPVATAKLTDESGTQELQVRKSKDTYYAKSSAVNGAYKVTSDLGKALAKNVDDFRNKKLFDFGYSDPNRIELHSGSKSYFLTRGTGGYDDWWSNGKKMDSNADTVVSDIRDLSASKFVDSGFSNPTIDLAVTSDDGKRIEKVAIAKSGDHYVAKRDNDPSLYQIDASPVDDLLKAADALKPAAK